jgi:hypothetical protein
MKLLVLILGARVSPYPEIIKNSLATWGTLANENTVVYAYYGNHHKTEIVNNELLIGTNDLNITLKTLLAFEYACKNIEFDYLVRIGASSYARIDKIYEHLLTTPRDNYYAGHKLFINEVTYAAGAHLIYSRDIVEHIVKHKNEINDNQWADDWVIGKFVEKSGYKLIDEFSFYWLCANWPEKELLEKMYNTPKEEFEKHIFFRCKTEVPAIPQTFSSLASPYKRNDILKMNFLHKVLYS